MDLAKYDRLHLKPARLYFIPIFEIPWNSFDFPQSGSAWDEFVGFQFLERQACFRSDGCFLVKWSRLHNDAIAWRPLLMNPQPAIMLRDLVKSYGEVKALRGVDLAVEEGEIFGFLGPNGAGKTTTIRCMLDLIRPDSGQIQILGLDPQQNPVAVHARTGYLPGELNLDGNLTGRAILHYFHELRGMGSNTARALELAERLDVDLNLPIKNLSHGNKQKLGLIQALMDEPRLLLLDEPTSGLDPLIQRELLQILAEARESGATIFFSSHIISVVEHIANRVGILREGKIIEVAETSDLLKRAVRRALIRFRHPVDVSLFKELPGVSILSEDGGLSILLQVTGDMEGLIKQLAQQPVIEIETERPSLEEIFMTYYDAKESEA
jgi:ABC-2 type transport system ATP-binding protein